jgi:hypothetical protein
MSGPNVQGAAGRLEDVAKTFRTQFATVEEKWTDVARREFEDNYLAPMEPHVHQMIAAIGRLATVLASADAECGADYGAGNE